jgi:hypothetical protein
MTFLTLDAINSNALFAPIGHEEEFKRRIFLDNFQRAMTIREFQKTAGLEIKKKIYKTKTATLITDELDRIERSCESPWRYRHYQLTRITKGFGRDHSKHLSHYKYKHHATLQNELIHTKNGKYVMARESRFYQYYNNLSMIYSKLPHRRKIGDFLIRIGIERFIRSFNITRKFPDNFNIETWYNENKNDPSWNKLCI